ncbi:hypothetical protein ACFL1N_10080 [Thermodesulfobacteriota bacterium]
MSLDAPLISNLNVRNNITLIPQYHRNMPLKQAETIVDDLLSRFGMVSIADRRIIKLSPEELFCVMLLRAAMVEDAVLVLDRPFSILTNIMEDHFIMDSLQSVDDLFTEAYIYDCIWRRLRYRRLDGSEN